MRSSRSVSVVIPALNEASTVGHVVAEMRASPYAAELIVVDNGSDDDTGEVARRAGATVLTIPERGFGRALKAGFDAAREELVFKLDGDMRNPDRKWIEQHLQLLDEGVGVVKGYWLSHEDPMPVTNLAARPVLKKLFPELAEIRLPIGGIYLTNRRLLEVETMSNGWPFDLEILFRAFRIGLEIRQIDLGEVLDTVKPLAAYHTMAEEIIAYVIDQSRSAIRERVLFVMAHADDVEIWAGGTLLKYLTAGARVTLVILCGDPVRRAEAESAWSGQPRLELVLLGEEEFLSENRPAALAVRDIIDRFHPTLVITHQPDDVHSDHRRCFDIVSAGLLMAAQPDALRRVLTCNGYYERSQPPGSFHPDVFIDISEHAEAKYGAITHYVSQNTDFWIRMARHLDEANGFRARTRAAEAFQTHPFLDTPKASTLIP